MKIHALTCNDTVRQWQLNRIEFNRLTLLVGASGVGKTQILDSIMRLQKITRGESLSGIQWSIEFSINDDSRYLWEGAFENRGVNEDKLFSVTFSDHFDNEKEHNAPNIIYERLKRNNVTVIDRDDKNITLQGRTTVKLPQQKSVLHLLREEDAIIHVYTDFQKLVINDYDKKISIPFFEEVNTQLERYLTIKSIQESKLSMKRKLYLTSKNIPEIFTQIKYRFSDVFPFVEDIKIEPIVENIKIEPMMLTWLPRFMRDVPLIHIKEHGVNQWIEEEYISSGMYRTLMQISELYLSPNGTVILIDEFENSLGVNCINEVTGDLLTSQRDLQFIITSHHPYIINSISYENWKLVTRKAGVVSTHNATEFNLGKSKHEAFTQLINLDVYAEGVEA